jgi:hypothetical protein
MRIIRTTYRCAAAGGRDETRETQRSGPSQTRGAGNLPTSNARALIPQGVNSNRLRYTKIPAANPPKRVKPATCQGRNGIKALGGVGRSERRERVQKDMPETWETRAYGRQERASQYRECITWRGVRRESDGFIVATKRGNARGAKEPCCTQAYINEARAA